MKTKQQLQTELRIGFGGDKYPVVKEVEISALSIGKLTSILVDKKIPIEYPTSRKKMEDLLKTALDGSDTIVFVEMVDIDCLTDEQLEEALIKVSEPTTTTPEIQQDDQLQLEQDNRFQSIQQPKKTIREIQQELAENCGYADDVIWDLLHEKDDTFLKDKIKQLIPDQEKGQKVIEKMRDDIFNNVWAQRKYTNRKSVSYIFYVMVTNETDFEVATESTQFSCHPVFRCRKCLSDNNSSECCMVYVDETGRVYKNWKSFIEENVLPAGTMVSPRRGVYNFDENDNVILDVYRTPNGSTSAKIMNVAQTSSAVLGVGAACVPIAAAFTAAIAAPVVAGAGIIAVGVGAFSAVTSALNLSDRKQHEQSISIKDRQARASYLGIAGGVVGVAAAGATRFMTSMATAGKATAGIEILVNGINISTIVLSGSGVANGVLDLIFKYKDDDTISTLDVLQLSASLVLFTHSVYNFQLASQIANEARTNSIKSYRETLSNRQRKMFDKMSKETVRIRGDTKGKIDIIRNMNKIPSRQYLNDLFKINKQLNQNKARPAFSSSGEGTVINNEIAVDTGVLRQSVQHQQGPNILEQVTKPIPSTYNGAESATPQSVRMLFAGNVNGDVTDGSFSFQDTWNDQPNGHSSEWIKEKMKTLCISLSNGAVIYLGMCGEIFFKNINDGQKFQDVILSMAENFTEKTFQFLLKLSQIFIEQMLENIQVTLKMSISTESVLYRIVEDVLRKYQDLSYEFISSKRHQILNNLKLYYLSLNANYGANDVKTKCSDCKGFYILRNL